jgi:hypothetical protein
MPEIHFQQYFSYIMATSFRGGRSQSTWREPPTMGKQLVNFITCGCESSAPFFVIYKAGREPTPYILMKEKKVSFLGNQGRKYTAESQ